MWRYLITIFNILHMKNEQVQNSGQTLLIEFQVALILIDIDINQSQEMNPQEQQSKTASGKLQKQITQGDFERNEEKVEKVSSKKEIKLRNDIVFVVDPQYTLQKIIGKGIYGIVASGSNLVTKKPVAVKKVNDLFRHLGDTKRVLREIKILKFLKHRNIVALLDMMKIENIDTFDQIYLCMEFMEFNLHSFIHSKIPINDTMIKFIMFQILHGIYFMHSVDIIHRDLKPENILMNKKCELKIADMNLARKENQADNLTDYVASRPYRAPEIFIVPNAYTKAIDIWSAGCILAELLGRTILFQGKDFLDQIKRFVAILGKPKLELFTDIDPTTREGLGRLLADVPDRQKVDWKYLLPNANVQALDLLDNMLTYDTKKRFTAEQCLAHPYFSQFKNVKRVKCQENFDFSFDKIQMKEEALRRAIYEQSQLYQQKKTRDEPLKISSSGSLIQQKIQTKIKETVKEEDEESQGKQGRKMVKTQ